MTHFNVGNSNFEEVCIPVPWGHISGRWWGSKERQPILALHGWQDNAGSFDTLAPLLSAKGHSILCIDFPGHGLSSSFSVKSGLYYYTNWDFVFTVRRLVLYYNWKKISIMGHSLGGATAFLYAAIYPEEVEKYISFDSAHPGVQRPKNIIDGLVQAFDYFLRCDDGTVSDSLCKSENAIDILYTAYRGGLTKESCKIMMKRGMTRVDDKPGYHKLNKDPKLAASLTFMGQDEVLEYATRVKCEVLNIRGSPGLKFDIPKLYNDVLDNIEKGAKKLQRKVVEGTHHFHLNNPERVVDIVHEFLCI